MSNGDTISSLATALAERAHRLAEQHLVNGRQARDLILTETRQRLRIQEEREELAAKAGAERAYQQSVQTAELDLRAGLARLRWELTLAALAKLPSLLAKLTEDDARYMPLLREYVRECAEAIERDELVVQLNARDLRRLQDDWMQYAAQAAPGKRMTLSPDPLNSIGGVLMVSADGNIRFDNTFEGRMERLAETVQGALAEWLIPQSGDAQ